MNKEKITFITNVKIFDGERVIDKQSVTINDEKIINVGGPAPEGAEIIDAKGCTLLPGLIDAHSHPNLKDLRSAITFGVTMTYQMQGFYTDDQKKEIDEKRDLAYALKSNLSISAPDGHPMELLTPEVKEKMKALSAAAGPGATMDRHATTPEEAVRCVAKRVAQGADYIKVMIEDGTVFGHPGIPDLSDEVIEAACKAAHSQGKMAVAHTMSLKATERAIKAGIDGLMHLFVDKPSKEIIDTIISSGVFVCPTIVAGASTIGDSDTERFGNDIRVSSKLTDEWKIALNKHIASWPQGKTEDLLATVKALHDAGVDILAGSDPTQPNVGGMVHGASLHHELQMMVKAGLTPIEALRTATSIPARRFGVYNRGRIVNGALADLLLVQGDPTTNISDTLSIKAVWRQGTRLTTI
ncbi:amidohydrolase, imidazolonepropionase [Desulfosporosinus acidiphilus SJ4]|uniref:Amidohydrolase, imidazolonepropionase n=1 Tax=Desulfosporosinus acidiphilus (strain DSM 22704 / JCM 16185 / SJ4) TaxID=646529 RepID=I4D6S7_DESAJ|nr:amidohydrolase family protein [Desulfosporosinus acidiphilus]AFM41501.1 amidohydrolase, imidazolonepropionase [Desulfosporosinus acidiphilus SJ4]